MPTLTSYTKSTEENILNNPPSADGEMAFSTDTKKLFISQGTEWSYWSADKTLGNYYLGPDPVPRPFHHFDPTVSTSMVDSNGLPVSNGGSVAAIKDLAGGAKIESDTALQQPTLISAPGTTPYALPSGDARINGLPVWRFDGSQYLEPSIEMKRQKIHTNGITIMVVHRQIPQPKSPDNSTDSIYWINNVSYTALLGLWNGIALTPRTDSNTGKYWYNKFIASVNTTYLNRYDGDQGECSLSVFRVATNPNVNRIDYYQRHVTSLGSQRSFGNASTIGVNDYDFKHYTTNNTYSFPFGGLRLGTNATHSGYKYRGEIGEIIIWPESLGEEHYNTAGEYLADKWGFTW